jgi:predicted RND superfamily exporter protein
MSGSEALSEWIGAGQRKARISFRVPLVDTINYPPLVQSLKREFRDIAQENESVEITGLTPIMASVNRALVFSMIKSYALTLFVVGGLLFFLARDWQLGLISLVPNLLPIVFALGVMGWAGFPLDPSNLMIGGIIFGVAVDDTIHFLTHFRRAYAAHGDAERAVAETLERLGGALTTTTIALSIGFIVLCFGSMSNLVQLGLLTSLATIVALVADVWITPAIFAITPRFAPDSRTQHHLR